MATKQTRSELLAEEKALKALNARALSIYTPYLKQMLFHTSGLTKVQRLFQAPNQSGKTVAGSYEVAMHATGIYPEWFGGRKWKRETRGWVAGESSTSVRKTAMKLLLGTDLPFSRPEMVGTGSLPKESIVKLIPARNGGELVDTILVKHVSGGISLIQSMTYEQDRGKWQGDTLDYIWFDEEPPEDLYTEGLARITATNGICFTTFTPLKGMSKVVQLFHMETNPDREVIMMGPDEIGHWTWGDLPPDVAFERGLVSIPALMRKYPKFQHRSRIYGEIAQGEGAVFEFLEDNIKCAPFAIPPHWPCIAGIDFGINVDHQNAVVWLAWDKDTDTIYVYDEYKRPDATISQHATVVRSKSPTINVSWPKDGYQRDKGSGEAVAAQYRKEPNNLKMLPEHAQWPESEGGGDSHEAFIVEVQERAETNRFKVFSTCGKWFEEFRGYHRKDGLVIKERDDLLSATKHGIMMKRYAKAIDRLGANRGRLSAGGGAGVVLPIDPFSGRAIE